MKKLCRLASKVGAVGKLDVLRFGGDPIGITKDRWPKNRLGKLHNHVLTVTPEALGRSAPRGVAAIALFTQSIDSHEAFEPETSQSRVLFLSAEDLRAGTTPARAILGAPLPTANAEAGHLLFDSVTYERAEEATLYHQSEATLAGCPVKGLAAPDVEWLQSPESPEGHSVLFWFSDALIPGFNCGDGIMYVTVNDGWTEGCAWYQC